MSQFRLGQLYLERVNFRRHTPPEAHVFRFVDLSHAAGTLAAAAHDNVRSFRRSCVTCPRNLPETFFATYLRQSAAVRSTRSAPAEFDCAVSSVVLRWAYLRTCLAGYLPKARD